MEGVSTENRMLSVRNLPFKKMAGATGLEPATSAVTGQRSNQLSYAPAKNGGQNVCRLPMNRQQVCDVFSKKKKTPLPEAHGRGAKKSFAVLVLLQEATLNAIYGLSLAR